MTVKKEKEIVETVNLCEPNGMLNRAAVGWSRHPIHICNVKGNWPRKKKWNYWAFTNDKFMFSATIANIDYMGLLAVYFIDFETNEFKEFNIPTPFGAGVDMGPEVAQDVCAATKKMNLKFMQKKNGIRMEVDIPNFHGKKLEARIDISKPAGHETLNVVVPWSDAKFQFTSKQNTMPATGYVSIGDKKYVMDDLNTFACLDYGRGVWPYSTKWNWASCSHTDGKNLIGLNLGGMWTDGTGSTENGLCLNGKLYKISDDVSFIYDRNDFKKEWTLKTKNTDEVNITFKPFFEKANKLNLFVIKTDGHQMFGKFYGTVKVDGAEAKFDGFVGWAEEHVALW